jgi:uncharacterized glyoxalase superfamily protein PhnB
MPTLPFMHVCVPMYFYQHAGSRRRIEFLGTPEYFRTEPDRNGCEARAMTQTPQISLHSYFSYVDAAAAIDWLGRAFGFEQTMRYDMEGEVAHAELRLGDIGIIVFGDFGADYGRLPQRNGEACGHGMYFTLPDEAAVDAMWERAIAADATPVWKPEATEWGNYRFRVLDPEGYEWTFGVHRPGLPQE